MRRWRRTTRARENPLCAYHLIGEQSHRCRVFSLGFTRQGTRSLFDACCRLGVSAMHGFGGCPECRADAARKLAEGRTDFDVYRGYEVVFQVAAVHWRRLAEERPDARFVLPMRPLENWLDSCDYRCRVAEKTHGSLDWFWAEREALFGQRLYDRAVWRDRWVEHVAAVCGTFRGTDRLLVVNVFLDDEGELWRRLAAFLGCEPPPPGTRFPHKTGVVRVK